MRNSRYVFAMVLLALATSTYATLVNTGIALSL